MASIKDTTAWILLILVVVVGLIVGISIWNSLRDTRAELERRKLEMADLTKRDAQMRAYVDSLDRALVALREQEQRLAAEREDLRRRLEQLRSEHRKTLARLDSVWEAGEVIAELDAAFPHWKGQIREATRADGVHALIAPRFFGADAAETKLNLDQSRKELTNKDSMLVSFEKSLGNKDEQIRTLTFKADTLQKNYDNLWAKYQQLDKDYESLLKKKWFTLHLNAGDILTTSLGFAAGYGVGYLRYKD